MKKILFILTLSVSTSVLADSAAEEMCQAAIMAMGRDIGYAEGYCRGTRYSAAKWACAIKYTSSGRDDAYALGACYDK